LETAEEFVCSSREEGIVESERVVLVSREEFVGSCGGEGIMASLKTSVGIGEDSNWLEGSSVEARSSSKSPRGELCPKFASAYASSGGTFDFISEATGDGCTNSQSVVQHFPTKYHIIATHHRKNVRM
jgi:hypothetical protein